MDDVTKKIDAAIASLLLQSLHSSKGNLISLRLNDIIVTLCRKISDVECVIKVHRGKEVADYYPRWLWNLVASRIELLFIRFNGKAVYRERKKFLIRREVIQKLKDKLEDLITQSNYRLTKN